MSFYTGKNGREERNMQILLKVLTIILINCCLTSWYWAEAIVYIAFTLNCVGKSGIKNKTPYEVFFSYETFNVKFLRPFGYKAVIQILKEKRRKFNTRRETGIFIGYPSDTKGYKILLDSDNTVCVLCNVQFLSFKDVERDSINEHVGVSDEDLDCDVIEINYD